MIGPVEDQARRKDANRRHAVTLAALGTDAARSDRGAKPIVAAMQDGFSGAVSPDDEIHASKISACASALKQMAGSLRLGAQIGAIVLVVRKSVFDAADDFHAGLFQTVHFAGIVGQQADGLVTEESEHPRRDAIEALVGLEAQPCVRVDRVEALILKAVGAQFVDQADAAPFLSQI